MDKEEYIVQKVGQWLVDRRVKRTREAIQQVLLVKLSQKELTKITVTELIQEADCSRSTFYLHFKDVFDVYDQIGDELIADVIAMLTSAYHVNKHVDFDYLAQEIVHYASMKREVVRMFFGEQADGKMLSKLVRALFTEVSSKEQLASDDFANMTEVIFIVSGIIHVLSRWLVIEEGRWPKSQLIEDLQRILQRF